MSAAADFRRTLQTAEDAEGIARLLLKASEREGPRPRRLTYLEVERLKLLSERYADYAAALRETAAIEEAPAPDQGVLL